MTAKFGPHDSLDPLDLETSPGNRVRDLATAGECVNAIMALDMEMESIMAQIGRAESAPAGVDPDWRTRAQSAMRWKKRVRKAVVARQIELARSVSPIEERRSAILKAVRREIGEDAFDRCVEIAKRERPDLEWNP